MRKCYVLLFFIVCCICNAVKLNAQAPGLYINEVSQGPSGSKEWVELLVVGTPTCYAIPTIDLRGWYIDDNNGNHATGSGTGIAQGCVRFTTDPLWSAVPIGTLIVIYNDADLDPAIPAQDLSLTDGNCRLVIPISNCTLFQKNTSLPSTASATFPTTGFVSCGSWTNVAMSNTDDSFQTIDPAGTLFHSVSWGNNTLSPIIYFSPTAAGKSAYMTNSSTNNISTQANWVMVSVASETPGVGNTAANIAWICKMNNGCTPPTPISLTASQINASCTCTGSSTVSATGGFTGCGGSYTYNWAPSGGTTATASGLCAGNYTVTVTDINGCFSTHSVTITASTSFTLSTTHTNVNCNGSTNGSATVNVTGGTGPFTYSWLPSGGTGATASGLSAGVYTVTVTDATSCTGTATVSITQPTAITVSTLQSPINCNGGTMNASVFPSGGTGPYTYSWNPSGGTNATSPAIGAGNYTCTITDSQGCIKTQSFAITEPAAITTTHSQVNVTCNGGTNGSATVVASGGTPGYTYSWSPSGGTAATASGLAAGTYTCTITDANSCTTTQSFTITQPSAVLVPTSTTAATCGGSNGTATVTASGGVGPYTYSWAPTGGTGATASGLAAGSYTVTVTSTGGCTVTAVAVVPSISGVTAAINSSTDVSCFSGNDGSAIAVPSGGVGPFTYVWSPSGGSAATGSGLIAGSYTCAITDANGCNSSASVIITQPPVLTATQSQTNVLCNAGNTGSASVIVSGGTGPYTYVWTPTGGTSSAESGLIAGNYTCTITDIHSCSITESFAITQPSAVTGTVTSVPVNCNGGADGTATVSASGGSGSYTYSWSPSGGTGSTTSGEIAGNYTVTITDSNTCTGTASVTINEPTQITASTSSTAATCGSLNGTATVTPAGGVGPYTYSWSPSGGSAATASGLSSGPYTVTVTDSHGCSMNATVNVSSSGGPSTLISASSDVSCFGGNNGSATVNASGGSPGYSYSWNSSPVQTTATASSLIAGSYTVTVTDAIGCTSTESVIITEPSALSISATSTNVDCFGNATGTASVIVNGGVPSYSYSWAPSGGTSVNAPALVAGNYTCTATDINGCIVTQSVTITEPPQLSLTSSGFDVSCFNSCDGQVAVIPAGGVPSYSFAWSTGCTTAGCTSLCAGSYSVIVTDANGCISTASATITQPNAISITTSEIDAHCNHPDGSASANATGGTGTLNYQWIGGPATSNWNSIAANTYSVIVTDAGGCSDTATTTVNNLNGVNATLVSVSNLTCFHSNNGGIITSSSGGTGPYVYNWTPNVSATDSAIGVPAGNYSLTVTDVNGCSSTLTATVTEPGDIVIAASATPPSVCSGAGVQLSSSVAGGTPGYNYLWMPGLLTGNTQNIIPNSTSTYTVHVVDANGCSDSTTVLITLNPTPLASFIGDTLSGCSPVCVNFSDLSFVTAPAAIVSWNWDFGDGNISSQQNPQHCYTDPGIYSVVLNIKTADGCTSTITMPSYITVFASPVAGFTASPQPTTILNPELFFTDTSSNAVSWNWSFGDLANSSSSVQNPSFIYPEAICYHVELTVSSANGCTDVATQEVCLSPEISIYMPNAFTPNGDGMNDYFFPKGEGIDWGTVHMYIFDRWGNLIYETEDINKPWDGKAKGGTQIAQEDVYVWKITVRDLSGNSHDLTGHVTLIK